LQQSRNASRRFRIVGGEGQDHTDAPHPLTLLRVCSERPTRCRAPTIFMKSRRRIAVPVFDDALTALTTD